MAESAFPVCSSVLSTDALVERVLPHYALAAPRQCRLISRSMNDIYEVKAGLETSYLRISGHEWRSREELQSELAFVSDLAAEGLAAASVVPRVDGEYLTPLAAPEGTRFAVLFAAAPGEPARDISTEQARAYGQLAAFVHDTADARPDRYPRFAIDERHLLDAPMATVRAVMPDGGEELAYLERVVDRVRQRLAELPRSSPAFGLCHGDLHPGNIRVDADSRITLFDFDCMGYGWRAYDLAVLLWNAFGERRPKRWRESRWRAFLGGYRDVRPLPEELDGLLPLFLVARQVWLMGLDGADRSGWPPQWIGQGWLRDMVRPIRSWVEAYPMLAG